MLTKEAHALVPRLASLLASPTRGKFIRAVMKADRNDKVTYTARKVRLLVNRIITAECNEAST